MSFFTPDFNAPGAGVPKGEPQKPGFLRYFIVAKRKFWDLIILNMLYVLFSLPALFLYLFIGIYHFGGVANEQLRLFLPMVFAFMATSLLGSGPGRAGLCYVLRNYSREEHAFLWSDYWEYTKKYLGRGLLLLLIDALFSWLILLDIMVYGAQGTFAGMIAAYIAVFLYIIYILMHPYLYMLTVTFDLPLVPTFRNAFLLSAIRLPQNLGCTLAAALLMWGMFELIALNQTFLSLLFVIFFSFTNLILDMNSFSVVKKYMIKEDDPTE